MFPSRVELGEPVRAVGARAPPAARAPALPPASVQGVAVPLEEAAAGGGSRWPGPGPASRAHQRAAWGCGSLSGTSTSREAVNVTVQVQLWLCRWQKCQEPAHPSQLAEYLGRHSCPPHFNDHRPPARRLT